MVQTLGGPPAPGAPDTRLDFLFGGGALGAMMRERDWSDSPLGPPADWPPLLKTTVGMMLPAAVQIVLFWGPELVALYNDSYAPTIGDKHPHALGRPAREHWSELWDDLEPLLRRVLEQGETVAAEDRPFYIERHGHPETVYFDISYSPIRAEDGAVAGVLCLVKETTRKVVSERSLRSSEERFHAMADSVDQMLWSTRPDGFHDYYNKRWYDFTGVPEGSTDGEGWSDMFHPEDRERAWQVWRRCLESGEPYHIEYRLRHRSGRYRWVLGRAQPVRDERGAIKRWYGTCTDIDELREAQDRLRQSEESFRVMVESLPVPAWVTLEGGGIAFANRAFADFAGLPPEDLLREGWKNLVHPDDLADYARVRDAALEASRPFDIEVRARRADGSWRTVRVSARPRVGATGGFGYVGVATDLTEIREAEARLRAIFDAAPECIKIVAPDGSLVRMNHAGLCMVEATEGRPIEGACVFDLIAEEHRDEWRERHARIVAGESMSWEFDIVGLGGTRRRMESHAVPLPLPEGGNAQLSVTRDVTARRETEDALRESEERFRNMADHAPVMMWVTDRSGHCTYLNRAWYDFTGQSEAEAEGFGWLDATHPDDKATAGAAFRRSNADHAPFRVEYRLRRKDGAYRWALDAAAPRFGPGGEFLGFIGSVIDIDERREIEDALRSGEAHLSALVGQAAAGVAEVDMTGRFMSVNDRYCAIVGRSREELMAMRMQDITHPHDLPANLPQFRKLMETGEAFEIEKRYVRPDGSAVWVSNTVSRIEGPDGAAGSILAVTIDIEDRKRAEAELREETQTLETLNRVASELSGELDLERVVQMVTDNGVSLIGAQFGAFFYNVLDESGESYMLFTLSGAERDQFDFGMPRPTAVFHPTFAGEGVIRSNDITKDPRYGQSGPHYGMPEGHLPVCSYLAVPVVSASGEVIGGLFFGHPEPGRFSERHEALITGIAAQAAIAMDNARLFAASQKELASRMKAEQELRLLNETLELRVAEEVERRAQAEEALRQAQKMETLGQLTGGVAHDFNNLLQIVAGNIGLIQRSLPADNAKLRRAADNAARGAERAAVLTQRLLAFSRRQPLAPRPTDLNRLVGGMSELLHRTLGETIEVETVLASGLWPVEVDSHQLENAILNLAINARDAMAEGGKLTIETCNTHLDRSYVTANAEVSPGQYVCICVSDSGVGMDEDTVARAFEPFFTTKEVGKGTGLGLSMVYGFVKQSGGHLKIYSEPGEGTSVKIYLPRLLGERPEVEELLEELIPEGTQNETILVCEDDGDVRAFTVEVLRELGYRVLEAPDGPSALRIIERSGERIDLLFTDVVLPSGMTGAVLAEKARGVRPQLKVLFTTGYARNAIVHHGRLDAGVSLVTKPFSYADLAARVRDMLDGTGQD